MLKILVPVDGSDYSRRALAEAIKIAGWTDAHLILLHVRTEYVTLVEETVIDYRLHNRKETEIMSRQLLEDMVANLTEEEKGNIDRISEAGKMAKLSLTGEVADTITEYIDKEKIDYVVIGSQGINAGKLRSVFVGSVTRKVLSHAHCPVLVVK